MIINAQYAVGRVVPKGRVLAHNQIEHTARTPNGVRSFRWWTWPKREVPPDFKPCKCDRPATFAEASFNYLIGENEHRQRSSADVHVTPALPKMHWITGHWLRARALIGSCSRRAPKSPWLGSLV
jgi:hypothetical protein